VTASDDHGRGGDGAGSGAGHERSPGDRAMDVLFYAPAGAVLSVLDDFPELATKGRARLEQELRNAQIVGQFVVQMGWRELQRQFASLTTHRSLGGVVARRRPGGGEEAGPAPAAGHDGGRPAREPPDPGAPTAPDGEAGSRPLGRRAGGADGTGGGGTGRDPAVDRVIPDYDTLSASQVVRRLDGLGPEELRAVVRHELSARGRRTIVHRAEQLLGTAGPPGAGPVS
jgi:hypothetical protein